MSVQTEPAAPPAAPAAPTPAKPRRSRDKARVLHAYTWVIIAWLSLPIAVMILFGFNNTTGRFNFVWQGFTLRWYRQLFEIPDLTTALVNSITIAVIVTIIATALGTGIGMALGKHKFRGRGAVDILLFANIASPEITMGAALLSLFITLGIPRGYWTIVIAHVMFDIAYVAVTVRARMAGFDKSLEEAARDLGAGPVATFRLVTFPQILPGIVAGALLAFALSIDDYIITQFNAGDTQTFPLWVYGVSRLGAPPQVNVMGTLVFAGGLLLVLVNVALMRRRRA
jgi:spermidine/putrescine transport system permease protein